jgi:Protein of unknown function (DUF1553)/Protein of unknown function (DUF1549)/Planctomycete cytochrome C
MDRLRIGYQLRRSLLLLGILGSVVSGAGLRRSRAEVPSPPLFHRAVNLGGPALIIAGRTWAGDDAPWLKTRDSTFENQAVPLIPEAEPALAQMLRSCRHNTQARIELRDLEPGAYSLRVYVWEDNNSETFSLTLDGQVVGRDLKSGLEGEWQRLGPYVVQVGDSKQIVLTTKGGHANLSGIEIWRGVGEIPEPMGEPEVPLPEVTPAVAKLFSQRVAPILAQHCIECHHGTDAGGGLDLATWKGMTQGGDTGPAFVIGHPDQSLLMQHIVSGEMPQKRPPLSPTDQQSLRQWIELGAGWPVREINPYSLSTDRRAGYDWWSLQPLQKPPVPAVAASSWARNEIDAFILAKLESEQLTPAPEADRRTLARRLSFDLLGLPPRPEQVAELVKSDDPRAFEALVDRLLDSPHYGEHWARHWLDVVRYGESEGYERNHIRENAWRYRDWVIESLNRNLPYNEFVRQQIAGDVLHPDDLGALIATGYHVVGPWDMVAHFEGSATMKVAAHHDHVEELVGTLGQAFLGLTLNCCRCHDHKFDPLPQGDYYRMAALLGGIHQLQKEYEGITVKPTADQASTRDFKGVAHVPDFRQPAATFVFARGDYRQPRDLVAPAGLSILTAAGLESDWKLRFNASDADRRKHLAEWLTAPQNPLTARVFVNRVWYYHFGEGLVDTPSDFGFNGGRPSHPELLDWLAATFMVSGYDIKQLHRLILTSATWRQSSQVSTSTATERDADNRWLWRGNRRRLEGESVRDAMLTVSGALNDQLGGPSFRDVKVELKTNHEFTDPTNEFSPATCRRSIYRLWARSGGLPLLESLDCPDPTVMSPKRARTTTPLQALSMLHNRWIVQAADRFASRVKQEAGESALAQVERAYQLAYARDPSELERELAVKFVETQGLNALCLTLFNTNEFLFVD